MFALLSNPLSWIILALTVLLSLQSYRIEGFKVSVAQAKEETANSRHLFAQLSADVQRRTAEIERARAEQELKNNEERVEAERLRNTLQATLNTKQRDYERASSQLREAIRNAPSADQRELGPTMLGFFGRLREQQQGWHGSSNSGVAAGGGD